MAYKPKHSGSAPPAKSVVKAVPKVVAKKANPATIPATAKKLPAAAKHRASGQGMRDAKQAGGLVAFGASKTRSGFVKSFDNPAAPRLKPKKSVVTYRHMLAAEFWIGTFVILFHKDEKTPGQVSRWIQLIAFILTWAILFGITATGSGGAKFASALGALILLTLIVKKGSPFDMIAAILPKKDVPTPDPTIHGGIDRAI